MVGVPVISPVAVFSVKPVGRAGNIEYTNVPSPPEPRTGVNAVTATFLINVQAVCADVYAVAIGIAATDKLNVPVLT